MTYFEQIHQAVCDYFKVPLDLVFSDTRKRNVVEIRHIIYYFFKHADPSHKYSLNQMGQYSASYGNVWNHATVIHAIRTIENVYETDSRMKKVIDELKQRIQVKNNPFDILKMEVNNGVWASQSTETLLSFLSKITERLTNQLEVHEPEKVAS